MSTRAFFALPLQADAVKVMSALTGRLRALAGVGKLKPRFVGKEQMHVTLKFLDRIEPETVQALSTSAPGIASARGAIASGFAGLTAFPSPERGRVLAVRLADAAGELKALASALEEVSAAAGIERETRDYTPHATLARFRRPGDLSALIAEGIEPLPLSFEELVLYASERGPKGAVYTRLGSWRLGSSAV